MYILHENQFQSTTDANMPQAMIALGANVPPQKGSLAEALEGALQLLGNTRGIAILRRSRWYRTPAIPPGSGPDFLNGAALLETALAPEMLLAALHQTESEMGRIRPARWAPRTCDLDLIAVDDLVLPDRATLERWMALDLGKAQSLVPPRLILPHPRMQERSFVLAPMAEVAPDWRHPVTGLTVTGMLAARPTAERSAMLPLD
jgi:2-amino-4-hydroxy-6-hydroxymethyldihydropteridine diphosphokinase